MPANEINAILKKEWQLEMRNRYSLGSILLFVASTIYVCYLSFKQDINETTWFTLFWIILLFGALNAVSKSFFSENRQRLLYLYTLASPVSVLLGKMIYNILLMSATGIIALLLYVFFVGNKPVEGANMPLFLTTLFLGCAGLSSTFTLLSAIAAKTNNNLGLMAILGFPLVLPLLAMLIELSGVAIRGLSWDFALTPLVIVISLNLLVPALSVLLFPYLWRD